MTTPSINALLAAETVAAQTMSAIVDIGPDKEFTVSVDAKCYLNFSEIGETTPLDELMVADFTTIEFTAPDQVIRAAGSWITDGYTAGRFIVIENAADPANNGTFEIESTTATDLTTVEVSLETEGASAVERINGYAPLEVNDTAVLLPKADSYTFHSTDDCEAIRVYNPDAVTDLLVAVRIAFNA